MLFKLQINSVKHLKKSLTCEIVITLCVEYLKYKIRKPFIIISWFLITCLVKYKKNRKQWFDFPLEFTNAKSVFKENCSDISVQQQPLLNVHLN